MSNFDTVAAITANLRSVLTKVGIRFTESVYDDERSIPASLLPLGRIQYTGESFENSYVQRPLYVEAQFILKVIISGHDRTGVVRDQQGWVHSIRDALCVDALNIDALATTKLVSRVKVEKATAESGKNTASVTSTVTIRYREA